MKLKMKINTLSFIFLFFFAFILCSCNKENAFDCVKSTGISAEKIVELEDFHSISVNDNIDLIIRQGQEKEVMLKSGRNLMPKIKFEVKDKVLHISNNNSCNWVRKFESPKVYVTIKDLKVLSHEGYGDVVSEGRLVLTDFDIQNFNGNGDITLDLEVDNLNVVSRSFAMISLTGRATNLHLTYIYNYGKFQAQNLKSENVYISHDGLNTIKVYPVQNLDLSIGHSGNVEYYHEPENIQSQFTSTGKLIKMF